MQKKWQVLTLSILCLIVILIISGCSLDTSDCGQYENSIFNLYERDSCWSQKAEETGNAKWCNEQEGANNYCVAKIAHQKGDDSICNTYATEPSKCYEDLADRKFDDQVSDCNSLWGDSRKTKCLVDLAVANNKPSACHDAPDRAECLAMVATITGDNSACDQAGDLKQTCLDLIGTVDNTEEESEGECKYDSDCDPICESNIKWKMGCNPRTDTCEKTFETDCSKETDELTDEHSIGRLCSQGECIFNKAAAQAVNTQLSNEVKALLATNQKLVDLMLETNKNCLNGLADVTNQLILDTASLAGAAAGGIAGLARSGAAGATTTSIVVSGSSTNLITEATIQSIDGLAGATPTGTEPADFIAHNCNLYQRIPDEIEKINEAVEKKQSQVEEIKFKIFSNQ